MTSHGLAAHLDSRVADDAIFPPHPRLDKGTAIRQQLQEAAEFHVQVHDYRLDSVREQRI
jgi:hypothetical protein